jgi:DNA-binding IclR family transcriptional regulator
VSDRLPAEVEDFVARVIDSIHQVELLMLLRRTPDRWWTTEQLARELRQSPTIVSADLVGLRAHGLVACQSQVPTTYRFEPGSVRAHAGVESLAAAYTESPLLLGKAIANRSETVAKFSEAFRPRRRGP